MATGDVTLTGYGVHDISGTALITAGGLVNLGTAQISGAQIHLIPVGDGQVAVYKSVVTGW